MADYSCSPAQDALIYSIYQGPLEERPWQTFLNRLRDAVAANYATLLLRPPKEGDRGVVLNAVVFSPQVVDSYNQNYFALDPFVDLPTGEVYTLREFVPAEELAQSEYYCDYVWPLNILDIMGADMADAEGLNARLRVTRPQGAQPFGTAEKVLIKRLLPHLQQSIAIHARLVSSETEREVFADAIDRLSMGVVILDENARVLRQNRAAELLLRGGLALQVRNGHLLTGGRSDQRAFRTLLGDVVQAHLEGRPGFVKAMRVTTAHAEVGLLLRPLPRPAASELAVRASVAVFISDPSQRREAPTDVLIELFGFTPSESTLALLLANGLTLDEASAELGVSRNTAKSHLSAVFAKTGVTRQTKLVQLILKSVAPFGGTVDTEDEGGEC